MNNQPYGSPLEMNPHSLDVLMAVKLQAEYKLTDAIDTMGTLNELLTSQVILGGGAVRDTLLCRPIKDYDMFTTSDVPSDTEIAHMEHELGLQAGQISILHSYGDEESSFSNQVAAILSWPHPITGNTVELIHLWGQYTTLEDFAGRFDFGLCQCAIGYSGWYISPNFLSDVANKTMTYTRDVETVSQDDIDRSTRRYARIHNKYPQYTLTLPTGVV